MVFDLQDTICAQSTPAGRGGIHIIRVSGSESLTIVTKVFSGFKAGKKIQSHRVYYGFIFDTFLNKNVDEVMVTYFSKGKSFTTEETVEISCHGNPVIVKSILQLLVAHGCRIAEKGEFTYRAYKGGRISLDQAEAVLTLIDSNHRSGVEKALGLLNGDNIRSLKQIENELVWCISQLEARIDFSSEDITFEGNSEIVDRISSMSVLLRDAAQKFNKQSFLNKGVKTLILGPPNVGKSSLFNYLVGKDRSIVSPIEGTTRDYLSENISIMGVSFELIDTAGLRLTNEDIELCGINMVNGLVEVSDLILVVVAADKINFDFLDLISGSWKDKPVIVIINKMDLTSLKKPDLLIKNNPFEGAAVVPVSVSEGTGFVDLFDKISSSFNNFDSSNGLEAVSLRQANEMHAAYLELLEGLQVLKSDLGDEYVLFHLNKALKSLLSISFIENDEIVRDKIFKDFCLGK